MSLLRIKVQQEGLLSLGAAGIEPPVDSFDRVPTLPTVYKLVPSGSYWLSSVLDIRCWEFVERLRE